MRSAAILFIVIFLTCANVVAAQPLRSSDVNEEERCCESKADTDTLAEVNGVKISVKDIGEVVGKQVEELQRQVIEARKRELDLQINSKLLDLEAKKRGVSTIKLLEAEVVSKLKEPTEAEAQSFYEQNKARIQGEFKDLKGEIVGYLQQQQQREQASALAKRLRAQSDVKVLVQDVTPPASDADLARVFATVNGENITSANVEDALKPLLFELQERIYDLRQKALNLRVNNLLLEQEAQKRKVTTRALLEAELGTTAKPVTEEEARKFYEENKQAIKGDFAQLKGQIIEYLSGIDQRKREAAFADRLRKGASVSIFLRTPEPPVFSISTDDQPSKGSASAQVTIVEFTDFECPSCARMQPVLEEIVNEYRDKVRLVVKDYPLAQHARAAKAAEAAEAAREQGKYWEYIAILFQNQSALGVDSLKEYASRLGLDRKRFDESLDSGRYAERVQQDIKDGYRLGLNATPTIFINGRLVRERTRESSKMAIEAALKELPKK